MVRVGGLLLRASAAWRGVGARGAALSPPRPRTRSRARCPYAATVTHHKEHMHFCMYGEKLGILVFKS